MRQPPSREQAPPRGWLMLVVNVCSLDCSNLVIIVAKPLSVPLRLSSASAKHRSRDKIRVRAMYDTVITFIAMVICLQKNPVAKNRVLDDGSLLDQFEAQYYWCNFRNTPSKLRVKLNSKSRCKERAKWIHSTKNIAILLLVGGKAALGSKPTWE